MNKFVQEVLRLIELNLSHGYGSWERIFRLGAEIFHEDSLNQRQNITLNTFYSKMNPS